MYKYTDPLKTMRVRMQPVYPASKYPTIPAQVGSSSSLPLPGNQLASRELPCAMTFTFDPAESLVDQFLDDANLHRADPA